MLTEADYKKMVQSLLDSMKQKGITADADYNLTELRRTKDSVIHKFEMNFAITSDIPEDFSQLDLKVALPDVYYLSGINFHLAN